MSLNHLFDSTPWTNMDRICEDMKRKCGQALGLAAGLQRGDCHLPPEAQMQRMLGKIDLVRKLVDELEKEANRLQPETQTKPKTPRHTKGLSAFQILAMDQAKKNAPNGFFKG
jgi:hypothetical protein